MNKQVIAKKRSTNVKRTVVRIGPSTCKLQVKVEILFLHEFLGIVSTLALSCFRTRLRHWIWHVKENWTWFIWPGWIL